jgi:hypothetical protein
MTGAEKGCVGSLLYIQKLLGRLLVGACQTIGMLVEKCGESSSNVSCPARQETAANTVDKITKAFTP